jgi:hypothetical protein
MSTIVEGAKRKFGQPEDVAAPEPIAGAAQALDFYLPTFDDDESVAPLGLDVSVLAPGRDGNHPELERRGQTSAEEGKPLPAEAVVHQSAGGSPNAGKRSRGSRRWCSKSAANAPRLRLWDHCLQPINTMTPTG